MNVCPECDKAVSLKMKRCACGWIKTEVKKAIDHRCHYIFSEHRRCPLDGTVCAGGGTWYCSGHWRTRDNARQAESILFENEKNFQKIVESRIDWRKKLFN